jgi:hypothetical protein
VIHRDIKPENILLQDGMALVADFGLARALTEARSGTVTEAGLVMGTPAYMAPEQASGSPTVDGRADIYALGCVLYEMLSGSPPFPGSNPVAVLARHISDPVPPLRTPQNIPPEIVAAVTKALAKQPEDRFQSAGRFAAALEPAGRRPWRERRRLTLPLTLLGLFIAAAALTANRSVREWIVGRFGTALDQSAYLVVPARAEPDSLLDEAAAGVKAGLDRWRDIRRADSRDLPSRGGLGGDQDVTPTVAVRQARWLKAGWVVLVDLDRGDSVIRLRARLLSVEAGGEQARTAMEVPEGSSVRPATSELVNRLLLGIRDGEAFPRELLATTSLAASRAFVRGRQRIEAWGLAGADSAFMEAMTLDPAFGAAALHLAMVRAWQGENPALWNILLDQAGRSGDPKEPREVALQAALGAIAAKRFGPPCDSLLNAARSPPAAQDFDLWYSAGVCLEADRQVLRDYRSPSGWRYRSSGHQASLAFDRAFRINPAFSADDGSPYRRLLISTTAAFREGQGPPGYGGFGAYPQLVEDTLAFVPWPRKAIEAADPVVSSGARLEAVRWARQRTRDLATAWLSLRPGDPDALESLGNAMELQNDPAACDTLHRARSVVRHPEVAARLAATEAYIRLKEALRGERTSFARARVLADTALELLGTDSLVRASAAVAGVAALTGKAGLAVRLERRVADREFASFPPSVRDVGVAYQVFAAMGGPLDSVLRYERLVRSTMATHAAGVDVNELRVNFLVRPGSILFPDIDLDQLLEGYVGGDYLLDALGRLRQGDTAGALARVGVVVRERWGGTRYGNMDGVLPEVRLMALTGRHAIAAAWLDSAFAALGDESAMALADPIQSGSFIQAMVLRANLASALNDQRGAKEWAEAVLTLWANPDPGYAPVLEGMSRLTRQ